MHAVVHRFAGLAAIAAIAVGFAASAQPASAAGLYRDGAGARAMSLGGASTADTGGDALDALFGNPATLADVSRPTLAGGPVAGFAQGDFHNRANRDATLDEAGALGSLALVLPVNRWLPSWPLRVGFGVNPDVALRDRWRYRDAPGGADGGTSYGVRPHESGILALRTELAASWSLTPTLSLGGGVGFVYNHNQLRAPYVFQSQPTLRTAKVLLDLDTDGFGYNGQVGLRWQPCRSLKLGVSYVTATRLETDGRATGNAGVQFARLGLGAARPDFAYDATVRDDLPQQVSAGLSWEAARRTTLRAQFDWLNWSTAFNTLRVRLRNGNNRDLNGVVGADRLSDDAPLRWRDQFVGRVGVEQGLDAHWTLRAGYAYGNNPVPAGTLTPLTAAITEHLLTAGVGYRAGCVGVDLAYQWQVPASGRVRRSDLAAGEYSDSVTRVNVQWLALTASVGF